MQSFRRDILENPSGWVELPHGHHPPRAGAQGLRVIIFTDDHEPAHVHVFGDGHAKINLIGPTGLPDLVWAQGMKGNEVRRAMQIVRDHQEQFSARWREIHG